MPLSQGDRQKLSNAGFTDREIAELDRAVDPKGNPQPTINLNSPAWQAALRSRSEWTQNIRQAFSVIHGAQISRERYNQIVDRWYRGNAKRSPWDWLKIIYQPRKKTDFQTAAKKRAMGRVSDLGNTGFRVGR